MDAFDKIKARTKGHTKRQIQRNLAIVDRIFRILESRGMSQKDLAGKLSKSESEISKWLTGLHNFELRTISKIEEALEEDILIVTASDKTIDELTSASILSTSNYIEQIKISVASGGFRSLKVNEIEQITRKTFSDRTIFAHTILRKAKRKSDKFPLWKKNQK